MPNSKIKNLILLILVLCNLCLLSLVLPTRMEERQLSRRSSAQLLSLYEAQGLSLPEGELPASRELYQLEAQLDEAAALSAARALLGDEVLAEEESGSYQSVYSSSRGSCSIRRSTLEAELSDGSQAGGSVRSATKKLVQQMGIYTASITEEAGAADESTVTVCQSILGVPVFSALLRFTWQDGTLLRVDGTFCPIAQTLTAVGEETCISCIDALVVFLDAREQTGWVGSAITQIEQGYQLADSASASTLRLIPVWRLQTDTGAFLVNGITREVTVANP